MEKRIGGVLKVLGTPAEEKGSEKVIMVRHGVFKGIDTALPDASDRGVHAG